MKNCWFLLTCLFFTLSESFSVDSLTKCSITDNECQRNMYQNVIKDVGKLGIPELGIPILDPINLKNVIVEVPDLVNLTLVEGVTKGIRNCIINKFEIDLDKGFGKHEVMCDFTIKGHYQLSGDSELLKRVLGNGGLRGEGKGKVKLEKLIMTMKYPFYPVKKDDGEMYFKSEKEGIEYNYDIKGKASFAADNIYIGKENISEFVVKYLNENWRTLMRSFGRAFVDKAMDFYFDFAKKFFEGIPAKNFITDDLTPYLRD